MAVYVYTTDIHIHYIHDGNYIITTFIKNWKTDHGTRHYYIIHGPPPRAWHTQRRATRTGGHARWTWTPSSSCNVIKILRSTLMNVYVLHMYRVFHRIKTKLHRSWQNLLFFLKFEIWISKLISIVLEF